jgi:hypothetical protein
MFPGFNEARRATVPTRSSGYDDQNVLCAQETPQKPSLCHGLRVAVYTGNSITMHSDHLHSTGKLIAIRDG